MLQAPRVIAAARINSDFFIFSPEKYSFSTRHVDTFN